MVEPEIRFIEGSFEKLTIGPEDTIVFLAPNPLSCVALDGIKKAAESFFPGRCVLILDDGIKIGALSPSSSGGS